MALFILFSGIYFTLKRLLRTSSRSAFFGASVGSFISSTPYGWSLGGINWLYATMAWAPYIFFQNYRNQTLRIICSTTYGMIVSLTTFPGFYLTGFLLFYIPFWMFLCKYKGYKLNVTDQIISLLLLFAPISLNWMNLPSFISTLELDSARLNGIGTLQDAMDFLNNATRNYSENILYNNMTDLFLWGANYSNFILLIIFIFSAIFKTSASTPLAVTSLPAPAPCMTIGISWYDFV